MTDKLIGSFAIETMGGLLASAAVITLVNGVFHVAVNSHRLGLSRRRSDALDLSPEGV